MKRNGFSRGELVALGAVVGAAGALLVPVVAQSSDERTKQNAQASQCMNNLKQIGLGLLQYQQDYDEKMPRATLGTHGGGGPTTWHFAYGWADAIQPYIKSREVFQCPAEKHAGQDDPLRPAYSDYWFNTNMSGVSFIDTKAPTSLIMLGDGDGGASNSNARYNLNKLPKSWLQTPQSPARRHGDKACYAFFDGHVKRMAPSQVGKPNATFALK